jgi:hypothetical protein
MKTTSTRSVKSYLGDASNNIVGDTTNDVWIGFGVTNGKLNYNNAKKTGDWGTSQYYSNQSVNDGDWKSVTVTHNRTTELVSLYINSVLDSTYNNTSSGGFNQWAATAFNIIGGGAGAGDYFTGSLSNVQIYNRDLSPFEVYQNYNSMKGRFGIPDIVTSGLTLSLDAGNPYSYNPLNTASTLWVDTTYTTTGGTLTNGTYYSGGTMVFDGTNDYVRIPNNSLLNPDTITVSAWINRTSVVNYAHFIGLPVSNTTWGPPYMSYGVEYIGTSDTISFVLGFTNNSFEYTNYTLSFGNNQWFNFTGTYDKSNVKIYINGVLYTTRAETKTMYQSTADFYIGAINASAQFPLNGKIGAIQVYNRALSQSEITQNFNALRGQYGI